MSLMINSANDNQQDRNQHPALSKLNSSSKPLDWPVNDQNEYPKITDSGTSQQAEKVDYNV